ncbi:MAG: response regulator [Acidimicrobiia bacterium]|jgi:DNA-binding response OmpR family regulator
MDAVLVVADSVWVVNDVLAAISEPGTTVDVLDDPRSTVARLSERAYGAVIVDLQVGSMGGMAVTRAVRDAIAGEAIAPVTTVLLLDRQADVFLARRALADIHLVKPFMPQDLQAALALEPSPSGT